MRVFIPLLLLVFTQCKHKHNTYKPEPRDPKVPTSACPATPKTPPEVVKAVKKVPEVTTLPKNTITETIAALAKKYPGASDRAARGVAQIAKLWNTAIDGDAATFKKLCLTHFMGEETARAKLFERLEHNHEILKGHHTRIMLELNRPTHVEMGKMLSVDKLFAAYSPSAHLTEDLYRNKIGFITALNFPAFSLAEKNTLGSKWTPRQWAEARMGDVFTARVPAKVKQGISTAMTEADDYISHYNIFMGEVVDSSFKTYFPKGMKLITHWNLRDELKSQYAHNKEGLARQELIYTVMKRIIDQSIPQAVINKGDLQWDPVANKVYKGKKPVPFTSEPDTRYAYLLKNFHAMRAYDKYSPTYPTYIERAFDRDLEYSYEQIEKLFTTLVSSPQVKLVGRLIEKRLGRKLRPFDIWYDGFKARAGVDEKQLSAKTRAKYKSADDFHRDIAPILVKLGFDGKKAAFIASKIRVDPARGAGHALGAEMRRDSSYLRTRVGSKGMDYKGYNIAIHELGHNVEQTITLQDVPHYMMHGVPNTAFTEAWAFVFQKRDLELLGMTSASPRKAHLMVLDNFWSSYEIMGVSLVDMRVWKWLYKHPDATKSELKAAVISIARSVWNSYFAPVFGTSDEPILAIYSHMIDYPLYLPAYPVGHLAELQIEQHINGKNLGREMERICKQGRLTPDIWMRGAVGHALAVEPTLNATNEALKHIP